MRVVYVTPYYAPGPADPDATLAAYPLLRELPAAVAARGHAVTALTLAPFDARVTRGGVRHEFIRPGPVARALGGLAYRWKPRYGPAYYEVSPRPALRLRALRPDIVHVFGLTLDLQLAPLTRAAPAPAALVAHYHGGLPERGRYRHVQRHNLARLDLALFTTPEQASAWIGPGLLRPAQTALLPETSSPFRGLPRAAARALTGMCGDPVCLSAGRLDAIKDPLTTLRGFARVARRRPAARLYCYYLTDELLPQLRAYVAETPELAGRVEFRGRAPLADMEAIYSSADYLLQASRREWSGLAVLEALSCGCLPVVTDIPASRALTEGGRHGRLFAPGDDAGLAAAVLSLADDERQRLAAEAQAFFERELSFAALARRLDALYARLSPGQYNTSDGQQSAPPPP